MPVYSGIENRGLKKTKHDTVVAVACYRIWKQSFITFPQKKKKSVQTKNSVASLGPNREGSCSEIVNVKSRQVHRESQPEAKTARAINW